MSMPDNCQNLGLQIRRHLTRDCKFRAVPVMSLSLPFGAFDDSRMLTVAQISTSGAVGEILTDIYSPIYSCLFYFLVVLLLFCVVLIDVRDYLAPTSLCIYYTNVLL